MAIPPCATGRHLATPLRAIPTPASPIASPVSSSSPAVVERYGPASPSTNPTPVSSPPVPRAEVPDPPDAVIPVGARCLHLGCSATFVTDASRTEECRYHPGQPLFHEGSKRWTCCKSATLTFEDFLSAPPCASGKHKVSSSPLSHLSSNLVRP